MRLFKKYKFSDKSQALGGTISTLMGLGSIALIIYGISVSFRNNGNAGIIVGSIALVGMLLAIVGCVIGLMSFKEDDKFYFLSKFGSLICGIVVVFMIAVFLMGIV